MHSRRGSLASSLLLAALASNGFKVEDVEDITKSSKAMPNRKFTDKRKAEALRRKLNKRR